MENKTCAITGHRPSKLPWGYDENAEGCRQLRGTLAKQIVTLADSGVTAFLSGMALGVDQIFAELVLAERKKNPALTLHCILPCMGQDAQWPESARKRYRLIVQQADLRYYVNREYHKGCMLERDRYLVEHSDCLLAVYDKAQRGGTAATVNYARELHRKIILVDPNTRNVTCIADSPAE